MEIKSNFIDIPNKAIFPASILVKNGFIQSITKIDEPQNDFILPGFIDAHVHIESSLLVPSEFAKMAVIHGTIATVSDPHEIANVLGISGIEFMIENGRQVNFHFCFGAPSCVPATIFETAGATLDANTVDELIARDDIFYLSEMMNFPGVLSDDEQVLKKINSAKKYHKPIDGHAPGLIGSDAKKYVDAGISTDHECYSIEEAIEKIQLGMKVQIREGSAAKNFETLIPLLNDYSDMLMFCSDDKHPDSLLIGHINQLVARAIDKKYDMFDVLKVACINPIEHYKLPVGRIRVGDSADFIVTSDLKNFIIDKTFIRGELVSKNGKSFIPSVPINPINNFSITKKRVHDFAYQPKEMEEVIECLDGQLITNKLTVNSSQLTVENDILKLVVVNRYHDAPIAVSFIKNFGLKNGAIASSVSHDSHNIVAVGINDEEICKAVNLVIEQKGGLSAVNQSFHKILSLPIAGLMSAEDAWKVAKDYSELDEFSKVVLGATLVSPFMSLSFMALLVIPHLKLSDKGLFNVDEFSFVNQ
jgi:adenine deaminase